MDNITNDFDEVCRRPNSAKQRILKRQTSSANNMTDCLGIKLFAGNSNVELGKKVAHKLSLPLGKVKVGKFSNGETGVTIEESVRNYDVYILQSLSNPNPNDSLMELLIMVDAVKRASPSRITAVIPYLGYARQDKKEKGRAPIVCKLIASLLQRAGVERVIAVDLHSPVIKGFWDIPVENISVEPLFLRYIRRNIFQHLDDDDPNFKVMSLHGPSKSELMALREKEDKAEKIVVSPDEGGVKRAKSVADKLGLDLAIIYQRKGKGVEGASLVGNVEGKVAIVIDDMADTCTKMSVAASLLKQKGALDVHFICTHGLFSSPEALERVEGAPVVEIVTTNTVSPSEAVRKLPSIKHLDVSPLLTEAIRRQHFGEIGAYELEVNDIETW